MTRVCVAVDVGNFAIKARFYRSQPSCIVPLGQPLQVGLQPTDWREAFAVWYERQIANLSPIDLESIHWRVASVNPPPTRLLKLWVETRTTELVDGGSAQENRANDGTRHHWEEIEFHDVPLKLDIRHPEKIGIDRLIVAWAGWKGRREATEPSGESSWSFLDRPHVGRRPVMIVDAGSAVTVDLVDIDGTFRGGAILPGRQMQLRSLGLGAFALPDLTEHAAAPPRQASPSVGPECPGRDTQAAIQLGVFAGMVGAIRHLREAYQEEAGEMPELILTGGDAPLLISRFDLHAYWVPHLLLDALAWL